MLQGGAKRRMRVFRKRRADRRAGEQRRLRRLPPVREKKSPTAIAIAKRSFNMDTAHQAGIAGMGLYALKLFYDTEESREGVKALREKRKPDFRKFAT